MRSRRPRGTGTQAARTRRMRGARSPRCTVLIGRSGTAGRGRCVPPASDTGLEVWVWSEAGDCQFPGCRGGGTAACASALRGGWRQVPRTCWGLRAALCARLRVSHAVCTSSRSAGERPWKETKSWPTSGDGSLSRRRGVGGSQGCWGQGRDSSSGNTAQGGGYKPASTSLLPTPRALLRGRPRTAGAPERRRRSPVRGGLRAGTASPPAGSADASRHVAALRFARGLAGGEARRLSPRRWPHAQASAVTSALTVGHTPGQAALTPQRALPSAGTALSLPACFRQKARVLSPASSVSTVLLWMPQVRYSHRGGAAAFPGLPARSREPPRSVGRRVFFFFPICTFFCSFKTLPTPLPPKSLRFAFRTHLLYRA